MKRSVCLMASRQQMAEAQRLDEAIWKNLEEFGYGDHYS